MKRRRATESTMASQYLQSELILSGQRQMLTISRMVYFLFVKKFNLTDRTRVIRYKDGNPLNCCSSNLRLSTFSEMQCSAYSTGNRQNNFTAAARPVSQYTRDVRFVKQFPSAALAASAVGVNRTGISHAALHQRTSAGFYWQYGKPARTIII